MSRILYLNNRNKIFFVLRFPINNIKNNMFRFVRTFFNRQKYSSVYIPLLSTKNEQYSNRISSFMPLTVLFTTSSISFYEIYKRYYRLYALSNNDSIISSTSKNSLIVNDQKSLSEKIPYSKKFNFIADVVEHVAPAVVHIEVDLEVQPYFEYFNSQFSTTNGSGFIINETGLVLTNAHVVRNRTNVKN